MVLCVAQGFFYHRDFIYHRVFFTIERHREYTESHREYTPCPGFSGVKIRVYIYIP